ncbi:MAG: diacylglycerol kinase family lipid kinase [Muribaculaceae bacterium]|nr:diacylglycerol kinase family lipid kinase [Muribaculaceae bacterium]MBR5673516.1 diacylglycerol kinase family lipid kinase [Muribaculaceae bacterium]
MEEKRRHIVAIINPVSGIGRKDKIPRLIDTAVDHDRYDVSIIATEYPGHAREIAAQAVRDGVDIVVAIGGDGTVNEVGSALCGSDTTLAIVPNGSGNGLARHLRIPMNASRALHLINDGVKGKFDYCTVNGKPFFCVCGMGFDAAVSNKFANEGTRGFITYIKTTLTEYLNYKPQAYKIDIDEQSMTDKAFVIACCNAAQYGNNAYIAPRATMQDGLIDVTVMHPFNPAASPLIGARLFLRQLNYDNHVSIYRGKRVVIERRHDDVIHIDGDPVMMPARIAIENVAAGINILVPRTLPDDV